MANEDVIKEMPEYHAHKPVRAAPIVDYGEDLGSWTVTIEIADGTLRVLAVDSSWIDLYRPDVGNYVVVGSDGQLAYSAARDFEPTFVDAAQEVVKEGRTVFSREHAFRKSGSGEPVLASTVAADRLAELEPWEVKPRAEAVEPVEPVEPVEDGAIRSPR